MPELYYLREEGGTIHADSIPDLDDWGVDDWWGCSEWIAWHKANKRKYGKAVANQKFAKSWNEQTFGAGALDCRTVNSEFRAYIQRNDLHGAVWEGAGIFRYVLDPIGAGGEVVTGITRTVSGTARALPWIALGLGIVVTGYVGYRVYQTERKR